MASEAGWVEREVYAKGVNMDFIRAYAFTGNSMNAPAPALGELKALASVLLDYAKGLISNGRISELEALCCHIPGAISRSMLAAKDLQNRPLIQGAWYEILFGVVTMAGEAFASPHPPSDMDRVMSMLFLALENGLNSGCEAYKERRKMGLYDMVVTSIRLPSVLQVPGLLVRVNGSVKTPYTFCAVTGEVTTSEIPCVCCRIPAWADPVLFSLTWLLVKSGGGKGYELVLRMLRSMQQNLELPTVALLLHQLVRTASCFDNVTRLMKLFTASPIIDELIKKVCTKVFQWLTPLSQSISGMTMIRENPQAFSALVRHFHSILICGVRSGTSGFEISGFESVVLSLCNFQRRIWDLFVAARWLDAVTLMVAEAIELIPASSSGEDTLVSHKWLVESKLISKLLFANKTLANTQQVLQLLTVLGKHKVIIEESDFIDLITEQPQSVECPQTNGTDLVTATVLELLDLSAYSQDFLSAVLTWLARRKADSVIRGRRIFFILSKLVALDKQGTLQAGISTVMAMNVANVADTEIAGSFTSMTRHYMRIQQQQECRMCRMRKIQAEENREREIREREIREREIREREIGEREYRESEKRKRDNMERANESMESARKKAKADAARKHDDSDDDVKIVSFSKPCPATK